jgi:hypothetical protein
VSLVFGGWEPRYVRFVEAVELLAGFPDPLAVCEASEWLIEAV